ncbi:hypothetical protein SEUCBS139899_008763 [Sporothrix eucalyptigena]
MSPTLLAIAMRQNYDDDLLVTGVKPKTTGEKAEQGIAWAFVAIACLITLVAIFLFFGAICTCFCDVCSGKAKEARQRNVHAREARNARNAARNNDLELGVVRVAMPREPPPAYRPNNVANAHNINNVNDLNDVNAALAAAQSIPVDHDNDDPAVSDSESESSEAPLAPKDRRSCSF